MSSGGSSSFTRVLTGGLTSDNDKGNQILDPLDLFGHQAKTAADQAAGYITQAAQNAADEQRRQSEITQQNMAPWLQAGGKALGIQSALTGANGPEAQQAALDNMRMSPGQMFMQKQQEKAMLADASRTGGLGGGNIRADLNKQGILNQANNFNTDYNRLAGISGTGQTSATNLNQLGQQSAMNQSQIAMDAGQARASGILGAQQMQAQNLGNAAGLAGTAFGAYRQNQNTNIDNGGFNAINNKGLF